MPVQGRLTKTAKRAQKVNAENVEQTLKNLKPQDFDRSVKQGRDNMFFLKREAIERLSATTRYSEAELQNLKNIYVTFAVAG